ncbi:hypothetical protein [Leptospira santarosai]|uniref:Uncharacterized protein n=1 Tax=Leptospira santarosai serovar Shermani str. LT 821 TaxID=758847 RepID=K8Y5M6_9LEPT|nr:hypothetical protein [Leptospira santarosai]EKT88276.1 hypothetical protein LSS_02749 [Leptospira santarosai serovar Shermani str. LT 821]EPG82716.1 hypothetical protein LEP1GSC048_3863 [Leptospira santarosai serovar Shermani str. 1342KT]
MKLKLLPVSEIFSFAKTKGSILLKKILILLVTALLFGFLSNCSSVPDYRGLNNSAKYLVTEAEVLIKEGKTYEAANLLWQILQINPEDKKLKSLFDSLPTEVKNSFSEPKIFGYNKAHRVPVDPSVGERILWYIPDRVLDILDLASFNLNYGLQAGIGIWVTRAVQGVAYVGANAGFGWYQKRQLGGHAESVAEVVIGPVGASAIVASKVGTGGIESTGRALLFHTPYHPLYQEYRDYWGVGMKLGLGFLGGEVEVHLVEIADLLLGIFTFDFLNDDFAKSSRFKYTDLQKQNFKTFANTITDLDQKQKEEYQKQYPTVVEDSAPATVDPKATPKKKN